MINTPETDRLAEEFKRNTLPDDVKLDILFGFTRKLERECIRAEGETEKLERERAEARKEIDNIYKILSESGEAIGNGVHDYSIIEMIQNIIRSKSYFIRKSYAEFFKPTVDEEGAK
jgi:hypothetical protein